MRMTFNWYHRETATKLLIKMRTTWIYSIQLRENQVFARIRIINLFIAMSE